MEEILSDESSTTERNRIQIVCFLDKRQPVFLNKSY